MMSVNLLACRRLICRLGELMRMAVLADGNCYWAFG